VCTRGNCRFFVWVPVISGWFFPGHLLSEPAIPVIPAALPPVRSAENRIREKARKSRITNDAALSSNLLHFGFHHPENIRK